MPAPIENNPIWKQFKIAEIILKNLFEDRNPPGVVICGPPGLGKSFLVRKLYKEYENRTYAPLRPSASALLHHIFDNRDGIILFDDFDKVFFDPKLIEIFKILLDSNAERILEHRVQGPTALPPFLVTAGVIFSLNLNFNDPSQWGGDGSKMWKVYIKPFKSRLSTSIFQLSFNQAEVFDYTLWMAPTILDDLGLTKRGSGLRGKLTLTHPQKDEIISHFRSNWQRYPEVSPRMIYNLGMRRLSIPDDKMWDTIRLTYLSSLLGESPSGSAPIIMPAADASTASPTRSSLIGGRLLPAVGLPPHLQKK